MKHRTWSGPSLATSFLVLGLTLLAAMGLGELVLRHLDTRFEGAVERLGWIWARLVVFALWVGFAADWIARRRAPNLRRR